MKKRKKLVISTSKKQPEGEQWPKQLNSVQFLAYFYIALCKHYVNGFYHKVMTLMHLVTFIILPSIKVGHFR